MITELRAADPAAGLHPSATSPAAEAMLQQVLAAPRVERRTGHPRRRLAYGVAATAALAAGTIVVTGLPGSAPDARAAGYTVARQADGSVEVSIQFRQFRDPAALQRSLRAQGLRANVLSKQVPASRIVTFFDGLNSRIDHGGLGVRFGPSGPPRDCAKYTPYPGSEAVTFRGQRFDQTAMSLRVNRLPADVTFVFAIGMHGSRVETIGYTAVRGTPPTCF